ncbi:tRNA (adenosine(37)-N6)-threonylcarbamoyltransferase complex dimerization subunit type 1 TsaB [Aliidiomarina soli]|uniref:tRNA threonylcarbamoyladenosine biosynthesis protein TsaB n=1 Tax=Aliidiomarina soli TaxID=1928574 RepID=A0A432WGX1_9GAMM|nr:tRNA (adenosine(37)-N6)-threonylcarbamoyltransferase complex dimerization subunit type 1 TsaB [Aliidiomarina soli]RUO33028.1 tRNA (adenosine(37)-N6)-threonylcarbamoyltransferase complex dimerization subunit type 1 TsaB [Aliidiomarina soli]
MKAFLAIDSATEYCSVALGQGADVISRGAELPRQHSQALLPYIDEVLAEAGFSLDQLSAIIVSQGPGSFTGVRIGASMAQGLAFSQDLPLIQVSTLAAMAQASYRLHQAKQVLAAIDARMSEVYWGTYGLQNGLMQAIDEERVCAPEQVSLPASARQKDLWFSCGTGWETYPQVLSDRIKAQCAEIDLRPANGVRLPHAIDMLSLGEVYFAQGRAIAAEDLSPHYLRNEVTWQKLPGR